MKKPYHIKRPYERRREWIGRLFLLPWLIGASTFFIVPLIQSLIFSFQSIKITSEGFSATWVNFDNYIYAFTKDPDYLKVLAGALQNMAYEVPIIVIFSLFIAVILNQKFRGRTLARAIMFLPVIVSSGIIISILKGDVFAQSVIKDGGTEAAFMFKGTGIQNILIAANLDVSIINIVMSFINKIFDTLWKTGIQILLFISSLQSVPRSAYEAAQVEGSTAWETFWLITFPLVSPMILVNIIYSIVDSFTDYANPVLQTINNTAFGELRYAYSSALAWVYFISIFAIIGLVNLLISRKVFYMAN
jgi:ABC-type sugar transport system permease subunit